MVGVVRGGGWGGGAGGRRFLGSWAPGGGGRGGRDDNEFPVGCRVMHPKFGLGLVESITRRPAGSSARVKFTRAGTKTLILEYAKLHRVE